MKKISVSLFLSLISCVVFIIMSSCATIDEETSQSLDLKQTATTKTFNVATQLGRGINMGNMYEDNFTSEAGSPWNPLKPEYFQIISDLGFGHVRIPIRWETRSMSSAPYTISTTFLAHIKSQVDLAISKNLSVIINMHHHEELLADPVGQKARFLAQWKQISQYFKNYSDKLYFEILNEPTNAITPAIWNTLLAEGLQIIRQDNPNRYVLVGTALGGGLEGLKSLQLPADSKLILTLHYYNPFELTHQGADWTGTDMMQWLGTKWYDTEYERKIINQEFDHVREFSYRNNIPVHIGEFGAIDKADLSSRARWSNYLARYFEQQGFSWAYWEFSAGFGIYDRENRTLVQEMVNALINNPMPTPGTVQRNIIYSSDFSVGSDGWILQQAGGTGTMQVGNGRLSIDISNPGTEGWNLQLIKTGVTLQKGKKYLITVDASSSNVRFYDLYIGDNVAPWAIYSGMRSFWMDNTERQICHLFVSNDRNLSNGRIVFDLGGSLASNFKLCYFTLSEIELTAR